MAKGEFKETPKISDQKRMKVLSDQDGKCNHCFTEFTRRTGLYWTTVTIVMKSMHCYTNHAI